MRWLGWSLLPVVLVGGAALGFFARSERTKTTTVVVTRTATQPSPTVNHRLSADVSIVGAAIDSRGTCQVPTGVSARDIWDLRRPGGAVSEGNVVAVATSTHNGPKCGEITVTFRVSPRLGFFVVFNENASVHWGPFDSSALPADAWRVHLSYNPS
jgi:hypothetical protein